VRGRVDGRTPTRLFQGDNSRRQSASAEQKFSRSDQSIRHVKAPRGFADSLKAEEVAHIHDEEGYRRGRTRSAKDVHDRTGRLEG